jgi:hypothetical protein
MQVLELGPGSPLDQFAATLQSPPDPPAQVSLHWANAGVAPPPKSSSAATAVPASLPSVGGFILLASRFIGCPSPKLLLELGVTGVPVLAHDRRAV